MDIDRFIARFIPVIGAALFVIGLGYLIYTSVWLTIPHTAKIGVGLFGSALLVGAGYSLRESMRFYADVVIGAGILLFYGTLVYASRTTTLATALLPEHAALGVSLVFTLVTAWFASERRSREILVLSMLGAYLLPFVIGQETSWRYQIPYDAYLLYFFAVNLGIFALSRRLWIGDIVPLNAAGLFVGTTSLHALADHGTDGLLGGHVASVVLLAAIAVVFISAMTLSSEGFPERSRSFFSVGYVIPLVWLALNLDMLDAAPRLAAGVYAAMAVCYFVCWHVARRRQEQAVGRAFLYASGIASLCLVAMGFFEESDLYAGLTLAGASLVLWALAMVSPARERVAAYVALGFLGLFVTTFAADTLAESRELTVLVAVFPLLLSWSVRSRTSDSVLREALQVTGILATAVAVLTGLSLLLDRDVPFALVLWTVPGLTGLAYLYVRRASLSAQTLSNGVVLGSILVTAGYFMTFFTLVERVYPFPGGVGPLDMTALIGALSATGYFTALAVYRHIGLSDPLQRPSYPLVLAAYSTTLLTLHHELMALLSMLSSPLSQSAMVALATPVWVAIAA